jgi:hypothetical protein
MLSTIKNHPKGKASVAWTNFAREKMGNKCFVSCWQTLGRTTKKKKKKEKEEDALLLNKIVRKPSWATLIQKESNADLSFRQWIGVTKTERKARNVKCSRQPKD